MANETTVVALYDDHAHARMAKDELLASGIDSARIDLNAHGDGGAAAHAGSDSGGGFLGMLKSIFVPDTDGHAYAEGLRRGGALLSARIEAGQVARVSEILERHHPVDIEERGRQWRESGWNGYDARAAPYTEAQIAEERSRHAATGSEEIIPVAKEELRVGKRAVARGGVRVRSYVKEIPVEEKVSLRDETVRVDRRAAGGKDSMVGDPFQERTIEMTETDEEAVVDKVARLKEEVVVRKDVQERSETIADRVRETHVDIENVSGGKSERLPRAASPGKSDMPPKGPARRS